MKYFHEKRVVLILILFTLCIAVSYTQPASISEADFSNSMISIAGPDKIYIRGISIGDETYSALVQSIDEDGSFWRIRELYEEEQNLAPESLILDFVQIVPEGTDQLTFGGIIVDGESYQASFTIDGTGALTANAPIKQSPMPEGVMEEKLGSLRDLIIEAEKEKYERKIASLMTASKKKTDRIGSLLDEVKELNSSIDTLESDKTALHDQISTLQGEKKALEDKLAMLDGGDEGLTVQIETLQNEKNTLNSRIEDLNDSIESLTGELEEAKGITEDLQNQLDQKEALIASLSDENETQYEKITDLTESNSELEDRLEAARREASQAETEAETARDEAEQAKAQAEEAKRTAETARSQRENALEEAEAAQAEVERLKAAAAGAAANGSRTGYRIDDFTYTKTLVEGFSQSIPQLGYWEIIGNTATQTDEDQYFAKLVLPIEQQSKPTLFTFKTRSRGYGWVGTGMHIFATDKQKLRGYGFGNSLLVWLTRDPEYYGTLDTRLQLYKSDDAVQMEMVLDAIIEEPMYEYLDIAILYEPVKEYITISVNGIEKLRYKTWFGIETGLEIALRSLGGYADFTDLKVQVAD